MAKSVWTAAALSLAAAGLGLSTGCDSSAEGADGSGAGGGGGEEESTVPAALGAVDKVDLLLAIDNSRSMADKQALMAQAVPELIDRITGLNPDISVHVGMITSSLGGYGSDACPTSGSSLSHYSNDDKGHLVSRTLGGTAVPTYEDQGFLAWDPGAKLTPPGEADATTFGVNLQDMVLGAGQEGCGYEAQLESWYRFLVDPDPYETITVQNSVMVKSGTDTTLLAQRDAFLRPDSMVVIVMVTDENDCSIDHNMEQSFLLGSNGVQMPRARSACATDINDPCCAPCLAPAPAGCVDPDPACEAGGNQLTYEEDPINLRCWDTKRRYGIDLLMPTDRYVQGLTAPQVPDRNGNLVANPLFADGLRDPGLVVLAGVVGVPWQDIARRDASGQPDLIGGLDANGQPAGGFMSADELVASGAWDLVVGDPAAGIPPSDPLMIESMSPRTGTHPITGEPLTTTLFGNSINGNETATPSDDLQFSCIMPLPSPRDCSNAGASEGCDCRENGPTDNPLCDPNGPEMQINAKAYPGRRQLEVLQDLGDQAVVASICAPQTDVFEEPTFGYRPAVGSLMTRMSTRLVKAP